MNIHNISSLQVQNVPHAVQEKEKISESPAGFRKLAARHLSSEWVAESTLEEDSNNKLFNF